MNLPHIVIKKFNTRYKIVNIKLFDIIDMR